jgi:hypothetical protein
VVDEDDSEGGSAMARDRDKFREAQRTESEPERDMRMNKIVEQWRNGQVSRCEPFLLRLFF